MTEIKKRNRIWELDFLRGFAIIMMVFDHIMYDFTSLPGYFSNFYHEDIAVFNWLNDAAIWYWNSMMRFIGRQFFVLLFLVVSGISFTFSKNNFKRGFKMLVVALIITLATFLMEQALSFHALIVFGVIHMFAVNTLIIALIRHFIKNEIVLLFIGMAIITVSIIFGMFTPPWVSLSWENLLGIIIGTKGFGADYFGILPYLGFILIGTVIGKLFYSQRMSLIPTVNLSERNVVLLTGRYSLWVYVLHQPLVLVFVLALGYIFGYRF